MPQGGQDDLVMNIVARGLDPRRIAEISFEGFLLQVTSRKMRIEQERRLRAIWMAAKESAGCPVPEAAIWEGRTHCRQTQIPSTHLKQRRAYTEAFIEIPGSILNTIRPMLALIFMI
jgi:hypothetical protein